MDDYIITIIQLLLYNLNSRIIYFMLHLFVYPTAVPKYLWEGKLLLREMFNNYNPNSENVGTFFLIWIKWKLKDFKIIWANILFTIEHREHNKYLNGEIVHLSTKWAQFKIDACYRSQKSWHLRNKGLKKTRNCEKIQLGEHLATN